MAEPMSMSDEEVIEVFRRCDALLEGHFLLSSGLHSPLFLQKARVFMYPAETERLCRALAGRIEAELAGEDPVALIVSPAVGGIVPGYETARHLGLPCVYTEREDGEMRLRRFDVAAGTRALIVEDVVSTGLSIRETIAAVRAIGAEVVAAACLVDRSAGKADVGTRLISLCAFEVPAYPPDALPPELAALPVVKPGSRGLV